MKYINFQSKNFPIRELEISDSKSVSISTTELNSLLMTARGSYVPEKLIG